MHLSQPGFTYIVYGTLAKIKEEHKNFKKQEIQDVLVKMN